MDESSTLSNFWTAFLVIYHSQIPIYIFVVPHHIYYFHVLSLRKVMLILLGAFHSKQN